MLTWLWELLSTQSVANAVLVLSLVATQGSVALNLVAMYKALGGGWELRVGKDLVPQESRQQMTERTSWGGMLTTEEQAQDLDAAASGTEAERGWWRWRWWWPKW
jgi:hypothetical protein